MLFSQSNILRTYLFSRQNTEPDYADIGPDTGELH